MSGKGIGTTSQTELADIPGWPNGPASSSGTSAGWWPASDPVRRGGGHHLRFDHDEHSRWKTMLVGCRSSAGPLSVVVLRVRRRRDSYDKPVALLAAMARHVPVRFSYAARHAQVDRRRWMNVAEFADVSAWSSGP